MKLGIQKEIEEYKGGKSNEMSEGVKVKIWIARKIKRKYEIPIIKEYMKQKISLKA